MKVTKKAIAVGASVVGIVGLGTGIALAATSTGDSPAQKPAVIQPAAVTSSPVTVPTSAAPVAVVSTPAAVPSSTAVKPATVKVTPKVQTVPVQQQAQPNETETTVADQPAEQPADTPTPDPATTVNPVGTGGRASANPPGQGGPLQVLPVSQSPGN